MQNSSWKRSGGIWRSSSLVSRGILRQMSSARPAGILFRRKDDCRARSTATCRLSRWMRSISARDFGQCKSMSDPEVAMPEPAVGVELGRAPLPGDATALDDGVAVGELHQALDILVDD